MFYNLLAAWVGEFGSSQLSFQELWDKIDGLLSSSNHDLLASVLCGI